MVTSIIDYLLGNPILLIVALGLTFEFKLSFNINSKYSLKKLLNEMKKIVCNGYHLCKQLIVVLIINIKNK